MTWVKLNGTTLSLHVLVYVLTAKVWRDVESCQMVWVQSYTADDTTAIDPCSLHSVGDIIVTPCVLIYVYSSMSSRVG